MTYYNFALFFALVCVAGFFYLAINGVYQTVVKKKPVANLNPLADDVLLEDQVQLPKRAPRNNHWHMNTFMRPRKRGIK